MIVQVLAGWISDRRLWGALALGAFVLLMWEIEGAQLVMHPRDPVRTASSLAIQLTFAASFAIATAITAWTTRLFDARG